MSRADVLAWPRRARVGWLELFASPNALHPAIVGDSPQWREMPPERFEALIQRTPTGRLVTMAEVVGASRFLLENQAINGINLPVDGGWLCT